MANYAFLLLGGPQSGAELNLTSEEKYQLGASLDADIYLPSYALNDDEITLTISNGNITLSFVNPSITTLFINGEGIEIAAGKTITTKPFDIICHGALEFCLKIAGQKTPKDLASRLRDYKKKQYDFEQASLSGGTQEEEQQENISTTTPKEELPTLSTNESDPELNFTLSPTQDNTELEGYSEEESEPHKKTDVQPWEKALEFAKENKYIIIALLIFTVLTYQGIALISNATTGESAEVVQKTNHTKIQAYLEAQGLPHLTIQDRNNDIPIIEGYLKNKKEKTRLLEDIHKNQLNAELRVKLTQDQISSVHALLDTYGIKNLKIEEADMLGSFVIQGYVTDIPQWDKVTRYLSRDFPDIKNLINQVETPETRKTLLEKMLKERQLLGDIEIKLENGNLIATTFLLPEDEKTWKSIIMSYNELTSGVPSIISKKADISWLDIMSLHIGDPSYIVLKDGKKYLEGTTLRGSIKLQQITEEGLIFETQRGRAVYSFSKSDDI